MRRDRLIFIPTYNESANAKAMYEKLIELNLDADILFIDDNSPDGTGKILDDVAAGDDRVTVIHRKGKEGIGTAHIQGINWAYEHGYTVLMSLDCDFTHRPEYFPDFLALQDTCDLVMASRYMGLESLSEWNLYRKALTQIGHVLTKLVLRMDYDATTSFRLYRLDRIPQSIFDSVTSRGYAFFFESVYFMHLSGVRIREVPVVLPARALGNSKMGLDEIVASLKQLLTLYVRGSAVKRRVAKQQNRSVSMVP
jgi:dolichol-phosphate mannosyltransferase